VLGGVSPRPLRSRSAETAVAGRPLSVDVIRAAAAAAYAEARPMSMNAYKIALGEGLVRRAFELAAEAPSLGR
jgi:xanthine dehydrogenase YagS FAD-binding subunit